MVVFLLILSIAFMIIGHLWKMQRWGQMVSIYEKPNSKNLLSSLSIGHFINALIPFRLGYIVRVLLSGKKMKNGYPFAIATVIADLYIDTIIVCAMYFLFYIFHVRPDVIGATSKVYGILFFLLVMFTLTFSVFKKEVKRIVYWIASKFNDKIEFSILYTTYLSIASMKDILFRTDRIKVFILTIYMWASYIASYAFLSAAIKRYNQEYGIVYVFNRLFSGDLMYDALPGETWIWIAYMICPLIGCYGISLLLKGDKPVPNRNVLPQMNETDRLSFLRMYYEDNDPAFIRAYLDINQDVSVVKDNSAGSNASTIMAITQNGYMVFRKYAFGKDGDKLKEQKEWIEKHQEMIPLPAILYQKESPAYYSYDMHAYNKAVGLFQYIHTVPVDLSWKVLEKALNDIRLNLHSQNNKVSNKELLEEYIDTKILKNLEIIRSSDYIEKLEKYDAIKVNGTEYHTLQFYAEMFEQDHLKYIFWNDRTSDIHGDLTIENIVCLSDDSEITDDEYKGKKRPESYYFIDPNTGNLHDSPFLDYAKLLQSLHGNYEFRMMVKDVFISDDSVEFMMIHSEEYHRLYILYDKYLRTHFSREEVLSIYYHEITHWLRLMPYKIRKNKKTAVIFYTGLLYVLDAVWRMENGKTPYNI